MLHQYVIAIVVLLLVRPATAMDPKETQRIDIVTEDARLALGSALRLTTVKIARIARLKPGIQFPGGTAFPRQGWLYQGKYVFTAAFGLAAGPYEETVNFHVRMNGKKSLARLVASDARIGAAVLELEQPFRPPPGESTVRRELRDIWLGRPGFALVDSPIPSRILFALPETGDFEYYWRFNGHLPLGTPLTDAHGVLLSLVGMHHPTRPMVSLVLPTTALTWCLERVEPKK